MALQDFRKGREGGTFPAATASGTSALTAFIDQGSEFVGKLSFKDTVRIDGRFEGEISSENTLIVGETGQIFADIVSEVVIVSGRVEGNVKARRQITLHKTGCIVGNVETVTLAVEEGAELHGHVKMGTVGPQASAHKADKAERVAPPDKPKEHGEKPRAN